MNPFRQRMLDKGFSQRQEWGGEEQEKDEQVMNVWVLEKMAKPKWRLLNARLKERDLLKFGSGNH